MEVNSDSVLSYLEPDHKVTVKFCEGYDCDNPVITHRVRQNVHGHREYCSLFCYARWSPRMREVVSGYSEYDQSPYGLEMLLRDMRRTEGIQGTAQALGLSRSTISYWLRKLEAFRNFSAQSTTTIVEILREVADEQGVEYAAELVYVDAITLLRSFERQDEINQAA